MFTNIRQKPKAVRKQYAFWSAAGITSVLAFVWFVSLQHRLDAPSEVANMVEPAQRGAFAQFLSDARGNLANVISANKLKVERVEKPEVEQVPEEPEEKQEARTKSMNTRAPFSLSASVATSTSSTTREVRVMPRSATE